MSDLLAIFGPSESDADLIRQVVRRHPYRVTVLIEDVDTDWAVGDSPAAGAIRDRLAELMAAIERETGATVTGLAGSRDQLTGWRFDAEVDARTPVAV